MNMKKIFKRTSLLLATALIGVTVQAQKSPQDMDRFIDALMRRMTVEEKIGQLNLPVTGEITTGQAKSSDVAKKIEQGLVGGLFNLKGVAKIRDVQKLAVENSRLGIPLLFGMDVIHGYETIFPIPLGLSCTWDMAAIGQSARIAAIEASADGISWTFSPMVDISRDPRWGRVSEGSGEDPFLGGAIARAMVLGYQGKDLNDQLKRNDEIMACVKHFALYGAGEAGRDYNTVDMSRNRMFNEYMYPYEAAVHAGVGSVMASFNEVDGVPATANRWLMTDVLRKQWGFNGFVVTDFTGISEMVEHGIGDLQTVSARALNAGVDMDMVSEGFVGTLKKSLTEGKITMKTLDAACRRILEAKYKLGLFDDPYKYCDLSRPARDIFTREHRDAARRIAAESFVLLKNEPFEGQGKKSSRPVLPLEKQGTVAVIGPLGNTRSNMPGTWSVAARLDDYPSLYEGLKEMTAGRVNITYAKGSNLIGDVAYEERATLFGRSLSRDNRTDKELLDEALKVASGADVIVAALGESSEMSGESSSRTDLDIPDVQRTLLEALLKTGKPVVLTLFTGRPLTLTWEQEHVPAILNVWFGGSEAAYAIGDVLFGDVNPSGKLTMTFPKNVGQIPLFYNHKNTGRPLAAGNWFEKFRSNYLDVDNEPLYPFGYGLSYTTFQYSDIALSTPVMGQNGSTTAVVTVTNTGKRDGAEVVQLYIRDVLSSITTYEKNLAGFQRIHLEPGEAQELSFTIDRKHLELLDADMKWVVEPGDFVLMAGASSEDIRLNGTLTVEDYQTRAKAIEAQKPAKRVSASTNPEDAENVLDEKINTAWQGNKGDYITFALKNGAKVDKVAIAFTRDNNLPATFEIQLSGGGGQFLTVYSGTVSEYGKLISYPFKGTTASDLRIVLNDDRVSIAEVKF
jgi:beta-glucosidase